MITKSAETIAKNNAQSTIIGALAYHRPSNSIAIVTGKSRKIQAENTVMRGGDAEIYCYTLKSAPAINSNGASVEVNDETSIRIDAIEDMHRGAYVRGIGIVTVIGHVVVDGADYWLLSDMSLVADNRVHFVRRPSVSQRRARVSVGFAKALVR